MKKGVKAATKNGKQEIELQRTERGQKYISNCKECKNLNSII